VLVDYISRRFRCCVGFDGFHEGNSHAGALQSLLSAWAKKALPRLKRECQTMVLSCGDKGRPTGCDDHHIRIVSGWLLSFGRT
jgi:hypothetical protein